MELFFSFFETSDVFPLDIGNFHMSLPERGRVDAAHGELEVFLSHRHGFKDGSIYLLSFNVDDVHLLSNTLQSRLGAESSHVGSHKTMSVFGHCLQVYIF